MKVEIEVAPDLNMIFSRRGRQMKKICVGEQWQISSAIT